VLVGLAARDASAASGNFLVKLERVEVEPFFGPLARVRILANPMTLEGGVLAGLAPSDLVLVVGGQRRKELAGLMPFEYTDAPVDLVVVIQTSVRFAAALEDLQEPMQKFLGRLSKATTQVAVVSYGGDDSLHASTLGDPQKAARFVAAILAEDVAEKPQLLPAIDRAIKILKNAKPAEGGLPPRKLMFIVSDGLHDDDETEDVKADFNKRAKAAADEGIVIHTMAFSMNDHRNPYRNLGQLSRKTAGTFRWAKERAAFAPMLDNLETEIKRQLVLTYFLPAGAIVGEKVKILCRSASCDGAETPVESNDRKAPATPTCSGQACNVGEACVAGACRLANIEVAGSSLGRNLGLGALLVVGGGAGMLVARKRKAKRKEEEEAAAKAKAAAPQAAPQIVLPDFSNIPYLANNPQVQALKEMYAKMNLGPQQGQAGQPAAAAPVLPPGKAGTLYILSGPRQGQTVPLRHGFTIGKTQGCDLLVEDGYASGYHAQFQLDQRGACTVVDMNSTNGTFVNGVRTTRQQLTHGMTVRVGHTEVRYLQG
jgi:hypothetical protein